MLQRQGTFPQINHEKPSKFEVTWWKNPNPSWQLSWRVIRRVKPRISFKINSQSMARREDKSDADWSRKWKQERISEDYLYNRRSCRDLGWDHFVYLRKFVWRCAIEPKFSVNSWKNSFLVCFHRISNRTKHSQHFEEIQVPLDIFRKLKILEFKECYIMSLLQIAKLENLVNLKILIV